jgi:membrane protease YdiL (CAAX protease family)
MVAISEEVFFRGLVLYALYRVWGKTKWGVMGSILVTTVLFAVLHSMQVVTVQLSFQMVLFLVIETFMIAFWWGALVLSGKSIWPAVVFHFIGNTIVAVWGISAVNNIPGIVAYERLMWLSFPLGAIGLLIILFGHIRFSS